MPSVVLADDEEFVRYFLRQLMESIYFEVVAEVERGDELVEVMREYQPDILLLDVNMPKLTGLEFLKKYSSEFQETCIIILTSATCVKVTDEIPQKGELLLLSKDIAPETMIELMQEHWAKFKKGKNV